MWINRIILICGLYCYFLVDFRGGGEFLFEKIKENLILILERGD